MSEGNKGTQMYPDETETTPGFKADMFYYMQILGEKTAAGASSGKDRMRVLAEEKAYYDEYLRTLRLDHTEDHPEVVKTRAILRVIYEAQN